MASWALLHLKPSAAPGRPCFERFHAVNMSRGNHIFPRSSRRLCIGGLRTYPAFQLDKCLVICVIARWSFRIAMEKEGTDKLELPFGVKANFMDVQASYVFLQRYAPSGMRGKSKPGSMTSSKLRLSAPC